jgi:uncharacterized protein
MSLFPLTFDLLGFRGAVGTGAASIGVYYGFGAILMLLGGFLEWILGNTFPAVVFLSFGAFWFSFGSTLVPSFYAYGLYAADPTTNPFEGLDSPAFAASLGMWLISMGVLCLIYLIASLRTNMFFVMIFFTLVMAFALLTAEYWELAQGNAARAATIQSRFNYSTSTTFEFLFRYSLVDSWLLSQMYSRLC